MTLQVTSVDLFIRRIATPRMDFQIGKGQSLFPDWMLGNVIVKLELQNDEGVMAIGCAADWPSFGWLDKRTEVAPKQKLLELLQLLNAAKQCMESTAPFENVFEGWWEFQQRFLISPQASTAIDLCNAFCMAQMERALIDAACRIEGLSFFEMLHSGQTGFQPNRIHPELDNFDWSSHLPTKPLSQISIRHTVGMSDPLVEDDISDDQRINDGLPQTLEHYVRQQGITHFKVKVCGDRTADLSRLGRIWDLIKDNNPVVTLDGNESFATAEQVGSFIDDLKRDLPDLFQHVALLEQPLNRDATFESSTAKMIQQASKELPLIVDEADGSSDAFAKAAEIGYCGVSHKNCKGVFKSLANFALCEFRNAQGANLFLSAEDLTSMPIIAVHQDFAVVAALGLQHAERNGHHYFKGLGHLTNQEQDAALSDYGELYHRVDDSVLLNIHDGKVDVSRLQCVGLGVIRLPDWSSLEPLEVWLQELK